ncbi:MAG TPA: YkvA family protein [Thermaerobacter sp.]
MAPSALSGDPPGRQEERRPASAPHPPGTAPIPRGASGSGERLARLRQVAARLPRYTKLARLILALGPQAGVPGSGRARRFVLAGVAYLFAPLDPLPGFIPVLGQLDDLLVVLFALRQALRSLPAPVRKRVLDQAGLDPPTVEHDWYLVRDVTRDLVRATGRGAWRLGRMGARALGRLGLRAGSLAGRGLGRLVRRSGAGWIGPAAGRRPGSRSN